jgi:hypothetical protein
MQYFDFVENKQGNVIIKRKGFLITDAGSQKDLYKQTEDLYIKWKIFGENSVKIGEKNNIICLNNTDNTQKLEEIFINKIISNSNQDRIVIEFKINDSTKLNQISEAFNSKKSFVNGKITLPLVSNNLKFVFNQTKKAFSEEVLNDQNITLTINQDSMLIQLTKSFTTLENFKVLISKDDVGNTIFKIYADLK